MNDERPREFRQLVEGLFRERRKGPMLVVNRLRQNWSAILGEELGRKTHPVRLRRKTLWLAAPDSGWAFNLQFVKEEILHSVRTFLDSDAIEDVRFVVGEIPAPEPRVEEMPAAPAPGPAAGPTAEPQAGAAGRTAAAPPEEEGGEAPEDSAAPQASPDARLRDAFARTAAKLKRRRRGGGKDAGPGKETVPGEEEWP